MARDSAQIVAFNRGIVSPYALARVDLARMRYSAQIQQNWMPRVFGRMMLRPGLMYTGIEVLNDAVCVPIPFIRATADTAMIEATNQNLRFIVNDALISRVSVATAVTNGTFTGNITGWTISETGSGSAAAYVAANQLGLTGAGTTAAVATQAVSVAGGDVGKRHALRIVVNRGPVTFRIGTALDLDDLVTETVLGTGTHSIAFTPTGTFYIYFRNDMARLSLVGSATIEAAGTLILPSPWLVTDLPNLRWDQSVDIMYLCDGRQMQKKIERRTTDSWSIVDYAPEDGPFGLINTSFISMTPSALTGDINLTASAPYFKAGHIGALFRIASLGQVTTANVAAQNTFTGPVLIDGIKSARNLLVTITGTFVGKVTLQYSVGKPGNWVDVGTDQTSTAPASYTYNDTLDNQIIYYQLGIKTGDYTSGTAVCTLSLPGGSISGIARITGITSKLIAPATVLTALGNTTPSTFWYQSLWSPLRGYPSCNAFQEGRLWWFGKNYYFGSVSDAYQSFDDTVVGDSGPIIRSISSGPADNINWSLPVMRLLVGTDGAEISARSSSLDEPLTPTTFNLKFPSTQGSARIAAVKVDDHGYFVQRGALRVYDMAFDSSNYIKLDYIATDTTALVPEIGDPLGVGTGFVKLFGQRQPDTRIHAIRSDGSVAVMVTDKVEAVTCWIEVVTPGAGGKVENGCVLPGFPEDSVYYIVNRTIGGVTKRFWEKWALEKDCRGGLLNKQADCAVVYSGAPTSIVSAPHLAGQQVVVWGDGISYSKVADGVQTVFTLDGSGNATIPATVSNYVVGLPYQANFQGVKLAYAAAGGSALTKRKQVDSIGFILADTHTNSLKYGSDFSHLDPMPSVEDGVNVSADKVWTAYDKDEWAFNGEMNTDSRICLQAWAPMPAAVLAMIVDIETKG